MNGALEDRAVAIIEGKTQATADEKIDLLLCITMDTKEMIEAHEPRLASLERWPVFIKTAVKLTLTLGAVAATAGAFVALV